MMQSMQSAHCIRSHSVAPTGWHFSLQSSGGLRSLMFSSKRKSADQCHHLRAFLARTVSTIEVCKPRCYTFSWSKTVPEQRQQNVSSSVTLFRGPLSQKIRNDLTKCEEVYGFCLGVNWRRTCCQCLRTAVRNTPNQNMDFVIAFGV